MLGLFQRLRRSFTMTVPEPIDANTYRRAFGVAWVCVPLAAVNILSCAAVIHTGGCDRGAVEKFLLLNLPCHALTLGIALVARSFTFTERTLRTLTKIALLAMHLTTTSGAWTQYGTAGTLLNPLFATILLIYVRSVYDAGLGLFSFAVASLSAIALAIGHITGWLTVLPFYPASTPTLTTGPFFHTAAVGWELVLYSLAFVLASYAVKRMRETDWILASERAARRRLEQHVAAREPGRLAGTTLPPGYVLTELLGRGGMGEVYEGRQPGDGAIVAIKVLNSNLATSPTMIARFRREADILSRLPASCATRMLAHGTTADGEPFFVMDRLRGEDLGALLRRRGHLSLGEAIPIVRAIANALDAAHRAGVIHRDLKPQNIFVTGVGAADDPTIRLLDFGISRLVADHDQLTQVAAVVGSPGYLAPEQARGARDEIGPGTDIFALGAIVYRMLTGQNAFPSRDIAGAVYEAIHVTPQPPSGLCPELPGAVDAVLAVAMAKPVENRFASAADLARALERALRGELAQPLREGSSGVRDASSAERTVTEIDSEAS